MKTFRHWLASHLCRLASRLRGERWYVADVWHGVPGNRAAELRKRIWVSVLSLDIDRSSISDREALDTIDRDLAELAQAAGESWGHA